MGYGRRRQSRFGNGPVRQYVRGAWKEKGKYEEDQELTGSCGGCCSVALACDLRVPVLVRLLDLCMSIFRFLQMIQGKKICEGTHYSYPKKFITKVEERYNPQKFHLN